MTDYIEVLDTQIEPEAPVTSELMAQLRDNPIAITEGSVGAPRVQASGVKNNIVLPGETLIVDGIITGMMTKLHFSGTSANTGVLRYAYRTSTDLGDTWTSYTNIINTSVTSSTDVDTLSTSRQTFPSNTNAVELVIVSPPAGVSNASFSIVYGDS